MSQLIGAIAKLLQVYMTALGYRLSSVSLLPGVHSIEATAPRRGLYWTKEASVRIRVGAYIRKAMVGPFAEPGDCEGRSGRQRLYGFLGHIRGCSAKCRDNLRHAMYTSSPGLCQTCASPERGRGGASSAQSIHM